MQRIVISMQNFLLGEAVELALKANGDFYPVVAEKPQDIIKKCELFVPNILLMEVTGYTPWRLNDRMQIRNEIKKRDKLCKIVLLVNENSDKEIADQIKQVKKDGLIDQFIYGSSSAAYLAALMETL